MEGKVIEIPCSYYFVRFYFTSQGGLEKIKLYTDKNTLVFEITNPAIATPRNKERIQQILKLCPKVKKIMEENFLI